MNNTTCIIRQASLPFPLLFERPIPQFIFVPRCTYDKSLANIHKWTAHIVETYSGCLQIQPNKLPGDFRETFNKVPAGFLH